MYYPDLAEHLLTYCDPHLILPKPQSVLSTIPPACVAISRYTDLHKGVLDTHTEPVAVKVWRGASLCTDDRKKFTKRLNKELTTWRRLNHPNIATFLGVASYGGHLPALALPFYSHGNALDYLQNHPETDMLRLLIGVASGLSYMHNLNPPICHGNLKSSNILISCSGDPRLTDISSGTIISCVDWTFNGLERCRWMAPELVNMEIEISRSSSSDGQTDTVDDHDHDILPISPRSDVYSFGMTALELYTQKPPFSHRRHDTVVVQDLMHGNRPPRPDCPALTDQMWIVIQSCWEERPFERPSIDAVVSWLALQENNSV